LNSKINSREAGRIGEDIAVKELISKGFKIIMRNFTYLKGEIDIIAEDPEGTLVFTEVKYRGNHNYGEPEYSLTPNKQNQIRKVAAAYLYIKDISEKTCRFDVISITRITGEQYEITHYLDAF
jgi:putative endonuclease